MIRSCLLVFLFIFILGSVKAQESVIQDGPQKFFYQNGQVSSEGLMRDGKPDGYWKAYYENGILKSEGNRKNFLLDSLWRFYNELGTLTLEINYREGKKNGTKSTYLDQETIRETFINDIKDGFTRIYRTDGSLKQEIPFVKGLEQGIGKEYSPDGTVITITEYRKGFISDRIRINRKDRNNLRQGTWMTFYAGGAVKQEGTFRNDKKHGYFKDYAENGDLIRIQKYIDDQLQPEAAEVQKLDIRNEYHPNGVIKSTSMYRNGILEGISTEYDETGKILKSTEYMGGYVIGEGVVLADGTKDGAWREFYPDGALKAEGSYQEGKKTGNWTYYHPNGNKEQAGQYNKQGAPAGTWRWYFENGNLRKEESYLNGKLDGLFEEFDETGNLLSAGEYLDGNEDGPWILSLGDFCYKGTFRDGQRTGLWTGHYLVDNGTGKDSIPAFRGGFIEDLQDGKHTLWWDNGKVREEGEYIMGKKEGNWMLYNYDGTLFLIITYQGGTEVRYDGVKIKPPFEREE